MRSYDCNRIDNLYSAAQESNSCNFCVSIDSGKNSFMPMRRLKKILDSWNVLRHRMRNQDEAQEVKAKPSFPTTGIIGAIAGDCFGAAYEFNPVKSMDFDLCLLYRG